MPTGKFDSTILQALRSQKGRVRNVSDDEYDDWEQVDPFTEEEKLRMLTDQFDTNSKLMGQTHPGNKTLHRGKKK